ncbi:cellulose biosynthesis cyclic di-GMP-binding regulatory protein BcsB [Desulfosporosinus sp. FKB]|uniref:cellulose biosynthesis cyclic di-GMP-binding regulatory protein BcsB n=1 Tax=Desulfosporosinus sp. FKB TaxID=1969835 RepID=UPI000B49786F|nr:cellulose biosynthesis cyclic di-GMP-binding regulatory protein BcsB [Desulfosporosinus sp. FKB]
MSKKLIALVLVLILLLFPSGVRAAEVPRQELSNLTLFSTEQVFKAPFNQATYYFTLQPYFQAGGHCFLDLFYTHSDILDYEASNMSVLVNGVPIASRRFSKEDAENGSWRVDLPTQSFTQGINQIQIATKQSTSGSNGQDIDNTGNWVVLSPHSNLHLELTANSIGLSTYPYPFLNPFARQPVQSTWYLPNNTNVEDIKSMLATAADWGSKEPYQPLKFNVKVGKDNPGDSDTILFGQLKELPGTGNSDLPAQVGVLSFSQSSNGNGDTLLISGTDSSGLAKATASLSSPDTVNQIKDNTLIVQNDPAANRPQKQTIGLAGSYTLSDLGYSDIVLGGVFHQQTSIVLNRPLNWQPGSSSYINVHFRHSVQLDPAKSALTVYINGIPVKSTPLDANNADQGELRVQIPASELNKPSWTVNFAFMNYLNVNGSAKRYDEVAWSVLSAATEIYLAPGPIDNSWGLKEFPTISRPGQSSIQATMWLSQQPDQEELTLAAIIAAKAAQKGQQINWNVVLGARTKQMENNGPVIMVGYTQEKERLDGLKQDIPAWPDQNGSYDVAPFVSFIPTQNNAAALLETATSPWNKQQPLFVVLGTKADSLSKVSEVLSNSKLVDQVTGQLSIISADGTITSLSPTVENQRNQPNIIQQRPVLGYAVVVGAVLLLTLGSLWLIRRRDRVGRP